MKIRCRRDKLAALFKLISSFTAVRDVRPALQNVKIVADDKSVVLTATDGKLGAQGELSVEDGFTVEKTGEAILPAKLLGKILTEITADEVTIELSGTTLGVYGVNFNYKLATWPTDDFPSVAKFEAQAYHKVSTKSFCDMIRRTMFAIDDENVHYTLNGVLFNFSADVMTSVATDGRRLAYQKCSAESVGEHISENKTIFPPRTLGLLERAAAGVDEVYVAVADDNQAIVRLGNVVVSTVLMEGRFPNWRAIMPDKEGRLHVDFIAGQLASAVRQAEIVATDKKPGVWFSFEPGKVRIEANGEEVGESSVDIPIAYDGAVTKLRLDCRFLNEFLRCVDPEETLSFYFLPDKPALFETTDDYSYVVMPLS